jgi:hypothetical protein
METSMSEQNHSGNYDHVRCRCCGRAWQAWYDPATGKGEGPHPANLWCSIHRPTNIAPAWVGEALARHELVATASNLPATIDDSEVARREVAGGTPTREWPANGKPNWEA